ncbi:hypothetical protein PJF56_03470 [Roseofilum sp. BLCC_M91]|uniref:Uncharacterized protein n=1 Tax=Roseofilum halophilum BLCC-M91 TaxID=3022259 RepID=A0ABT7BFG5_9CYAN|nr:hypothetical protein [Roseofilum halophilum]MDJ1177917.1 hypothetical protein [Roseofilum halophilum BLCC-M91]
MTSPRSKIFIDDISSLSLASFKRSPILSGAVLNQVSVSIHFSPLPSKFSADRLTRAIAH